MTDKKSDTWMPFYVGDYLSATSRLTTEQHGAYFLILLDYWKNGPPPNNDVVLTQISRLTPAAWKRVKPTLIDFFDERGGKLFQKRVEKERERAAENIEKRRKAGKASAVARAKAHPTDENGSTHVPTHVATSVPTHGATNRSTNGQHKSRPSPSPSSEEEAQPKPTLNHESQTSASHVHVHERPPPGITNPNDALGYVCIAAGWHPATDTQRQNAISIINGWLALGCSLELILDGIAKARRRDPSPTKSLKRFDSTIRGMRRDQLGGELPVSTADVEAVTSGVVKRLAVG